MSGSSILANRSEMTIPAAAGGLAAVLHAPAGVSRDMAVIFCHGFRGSKEGGGRAAALADLTAGLGFHALRFDFTPLCTLSTQVDELRAVVDYCRGNVSERVILLGRSMGGSAALTVAAADKRIAGLCLWSTPHDLRETFRLSLGGGYDILERGQNLHVSDEFGAVDLGPGFLRDFDRYDLLAAVEQLSGRPLLIVHGANDEIVPPHQASSLLKRAVGPKRLVVIPNGDHRFLKGYEHAAEAVLTWLADAFVSDGN